jgi:methionyl aminopeptidase
VSIEPIISARGEALSQDADGWTVCARDGSLAAHAEHTIVVTRRRSPLVLTSAI